MPVPLNSLLQNPLFQQYLQTGSLSPNVSEQLNPTLSRGGAQLTPGDTSPLGGNPISAPSATVHQSGVASQLQNVASPRPTAGQGGFATGRYFGAAQTAQQIGAGTSQLLASQSPDFAVEDTAIQSGLSSASSQGLQAGVQSGAISSGAGTAAGIGAAVGDIAGQAISNKGKEELGGALAGAAKGAAAGAVLGPWGMAGGAVIGGAIGAFGGKKKRKERRKRERAAELRRLQGIEAQTQATKAQQRQDFARRHDQYGNVIAVARNGIKVDTPFKLNLSSSKTLVPLENKIGKLKNGGKLDKQLIKENIIPDGPTHGRLNKTGVKGDKGLPVVVNGEKEYEIEKEELILNLNATNKAEKLNDRFKVDGDDKHLVALGRLMKYELMNNTRDYTKKFGVNRGTHTKYKESEEITDRPDEGEYKLKEKDIMAEGGKMQVLGNKGEVLTNIKGGERIFSRPHTKKLVGLAKGAKTKDGLLKLGKFMSQVIEKQDTQEKQYVED